MIRNRLEIGPGSTSLGVQWLTMDLKSREGVDIVCRWGAEPIPLPSESMSLVYASHVLEHVPWFQSVFALQEANRVLEPGGAIEVHVPDLDILIIAVQERRCLDDHAEQGLNASLHWMHWVAERLFHLPPEAQWHHACFNEEHLRWCLEQAGFTDIRRLSSERGNDHGVINLGMRGIKR